ncbi:MAG TPA: hypothetical protein PKH37_03190, partial [Alphaproteobacteria bacterium]|nr:hypothetical protein [Alphaproteobacteria bacterium]
GIAKKTGYKVCLDDRYKFRGADRESAADYMGCSQKISVSPDSIFVSSRNEEDAIILPDVQSVEAYITGGTQRSTLPNPIIR